MKVLLVGFSSQSADVLQLFIEKLYPDYSVVQLERTFSDDLRLCLPTVATTHADAKAMIIHLDGVGMMHFATQHSKALKKFIGARAALMVGKGGGLFAWENANILPKDLSLFITSPYTKDVMEWALGRLFGAVHKIAEHHHLFHQEPSELHLLAEKSSPAKPSVDVLATSKGTFHRLIDRHFDIPKKDLIHQFLNLVLTDTPLKLVTNNQTFYVCKAQNLALISNVERLLDYCQVASNFDALTKVVDVEVIGLEEFNKIASQSPQNRYKKYALGTILWQIYDRILPKYIEVPDHNLQLKMRLMPNFGQMGDIPEYVKALTSLCLVAPKTTKELSRGLGISIDKDLINRIFLLAILSGVADFEVLKASFLEEADTPKEDILTPNPLKDNASKNMPNIPKAEVVSPRQLNQGVEKAQKTGFLERLLRKLSLR